MQSIQRLGLVAVALVWSAGSCWAQANNAAAPTPNAAARKAAADAAQKQYDAVITATDAEFAAGDKLDREAAKSDAEFQKEMRADRDERWRDARKELRQDLGEAGFGDKALQDAILDFVEEQDLAREAVRAKAALCAAAVKDQDVEDAQIAKLLADYQAAAAQAQAKREAMLAALDAQVHFSDKPRLKTLLTLNGVLGSELWLTRDTLPDNTMEGMDLSFLFPQKPEPAAQ